MLDASGTMVVEFAVAIRELGTDVVIARLAFPVIMRFQASISMGMNVRNRLLLPFH
jgi:hypothetical protein